MGATYDPAEVLRKTAQAKDNPSGLINVALEELVRAHSELPGYTTPNELTKKIRIEVNREFFTLVSGRVDTAARAKLARLIPHVARHKPLAVSGLLDVLKLVLGTVAGARNSPAV